ncbi:radical SAM protein [candidate division TA06 bacterium]|uniref:Radical SAM protein n=1 Tax=candidate division TA06 bacterium TaxID=2250710 RepID=A0A933MHV3_UNCT6|nr:radical SAM protein [candidate division TA06 bacterium]
MNVLLINPPAYLGVAQVREGRCMQRAGAWTSVWPPLSLALTAAVLRRAGHRVKLHDCIVEKISRPRLLQLAKEFNPDWCLFNSATPSIAGDMETVDALAQALPRCRTAALGIHPTALPEETFGLSKNLEVIIKGEPEQAALELISAEKLDGISGISYRRNGEVFHNSPRAAIEDLDSLPYPAWDLIDKDLYKLPLSDRPFLLLATNRGCPFSCRFCADHVYYGKKLRKFSPRRIADEIEYDINDIGVKQFLFWAESFTLDRGHALATAREIINRKLDIGWVCNSRVDQVDPEMLNNFKQAGCWMIGFGVESGSQRMLDLMAKGTTIQQTRNVVNLAQKAGLKVTAHVMFGYPGETGEELRATLDLVKELNFDFAQFYSAVPFPGSELYWQAQKEGWLASRDWRLYEQNYCVIKTSELDPPEVEAFRSRAFREFYLRPGQVLKIIRSLKTGTAWKQEFRALWQFRNWVK